MGLPHDKKQKLYSLATITGGVNINDPATSLPDSQASVAMNLMFGKTGFKRWCGCENLTAKDAVSDYFRGLENTAEISGTNHLLTMFGGKLYEVNTTTGAVGSPLFDATGSGEMYGGTHWGKFFGTNGAKTFKVEAGTAYQIGITPPGAGTLAVAAGGTLPNGVYGVYLAYARKVGGLNVLFSQGYYAGTVTLSGGNNTVAISNFANSGDAQVNNKVAFMTLANGTTYYYYAETGNNTTTTISIASDTSNNAITYEKDLLPSGLPAAFTHMICFDNRIFGVLGNRLYYSLKSYSPYDIERFPSGNYIDYPFQVTGLFTLGRYLYLNTADNGVLIQSVEDLGSRFEHIEKRVSFKFLRTAVDWNGGKFGLTKDGLGFFDGEKFQDFDYSYNIRPTIQTMYATADSNFQPCAIVINRGDRKEYHLSLRNTTINSTNNNRTYVLNLSQTFYQDSLNFKTPWEVIGRGFNYAAMNSDGGVYFGQSFATSSTIYQELATHTTQKGIYDDTGAYLTAATNMTLMFATKTFNENMFTKIIIGEPALLAQIGSVAKLSINIADDPSKVISQDTDVASYASAIWDNFIWGEALWSIESQKRIPLKGKQGVFGYTWYATFSQTADDPNFALSSIDLLLTTETGRGS